MNVPDAATRAHRLSLLAGIKQALQVLDQEIAKQAETTTALLIEKRKLMVQVRELEQSLKEQP